MAFEPFGPSFTPATAAFVYLSVLTTRLIFLSVLTTQFGQFGRKSGWNRYEDEKVVRSDRKLTELRRERRAAGGRVPGGLGLG